MYTTLSYQIWYIYAFAQDALNKVAEHFRRIRDDRRAEVELTPTTIAVSMLIMILVLSLFLYSTVHNLARQ
jgi:hypothetical protein